MGKIIITRAVRGSDYRPDLALSEEKDKTGLKNGETQKRTHKRINKY